MSRQTMRRAFWIFLTTTVVGLVVVATVAWKAYRYADTPSGAARGPVEVDIPRGAAAGQVADRLAAAGLIDHPTIFRIYAGQRGVAAKFKPGHYRVDAPASPKQLIDLMVKGVADELVAITIPEGLTLPQIAELFDAAAIASRTELLAKGLSPTFARDLGLPGPSLEGYLYPDTYKLRPQTPPDRLLVNLVRRHRQVFEELRAQHRLGVAKLEKELGFDHQKIVTLASIVEKETGAPIERPRIAQVFLNRLTLPAFKPHLLQTDPTIIYGCTVGALVLGKISSACAEFDGRIRRIHLDDPDNPYNTYTHEGLPPAPISNPGRAALEAVMKPDGTPYLYFVSKNDGTHFFSATRAEHEAAVVKYQRGGKPLATGKH
jgi:UPF0755 protein